MVKKDLVIPESFLKRVLEVYPQWADLHNIVRNNKRQQIHSMLENASGFAIAPEDVVSLFKRRKEKEILQKAIQAQKRRELYQEFLAIEDEFLKDAV